MSDISRHSITVNGIILDPAQPRVIRIDEVAAMLGLSVSATYQRVKRGTITVKPSSWVLHQGAEWASADWYRWFQGKAK